jgi:hypothetical protein
MGLFAIQGALSMEIAMTRRGGKAYGGRCRREDAACQVTSNSAHSVRKEALEAVWAATGIFLPVRDSEAAEQFACRR